MANIYIDARHLIRLMYSCEILILPHDGTTDDTLCLAQRRSTVILHERSQLNGDPASLCGSFPRRDVSGECVLLIHAAAKHPAAEFSAVFVPLNAGGNGASNLVSGLPVKL